MNINGPVTLLGDDSFLTDAGHYLAEGARSTIGILKLARGDTATQVVEDPSLRPMNFANMAVYGVLGAIAVIMLVKKK